MTKIQTAVKERGIIFTHLIPEILDGSKTQTRRTRGLEEINENPDDWEIFSQWDNIWGFRRLSDDYYARVKCPYGQVGDKLWVKETWGEDYRGRTANASYGNRQYTCPVAEAVYKADGKEMSNCGTGWKSPRFMPRWASRIDSEITDLRAERLQDICGETANRQEEAT